MADVARLDGEAAQQGEATALLDLPTNAGEARSERGERKVLSTNLSDVDIRIRQALRRPRDLGAFRRRQGLQPVGARRHRGPIPRGRTGDALGQIGKLDGGRGNHGASPERPPP